jgi:hypothetical protein
MHEYKFLHVTKFLAKPNYMKNLAIICLAVLFSISISAQTMNDSDNQNLNRIVHSKKDVVVSLSGNMVFNNPYSSVFAGGLKTKMFLGNRFSLDADLVFGKDYVHFGPGIIGIPLWLFCNEISFSSEEKGSFGLFLFSITMMALSAEHIAYHIPVKDNIEISPFISMLRFKQLYIKNIQTSSADNAAHASFASGLELNRYYKRFIISPYLEYNIAYDGYFRGFNMGINVGYYFRNNSKN